MPATRKATNTNVGVGCGQVEGQRPTSSRNNYQVLLPDNRPESQAVDQPAGPSPRESLSTWLHEAVSPLAATRASSASQHLVACSKPLA